MESLTRAYSGKGDMKGRRYFAFGYDKGVAMNPQGDLSGGPSDVSAFFADMTYEKAPSSGLQDFHPRGRTGDYRNQ